MEEIITLDSIDNYNKVYGFETKHPLVTVVDFVNLGADKYDRSEKTYNYELYAIFLKETLCGDITYGRQPYDYQEGTVTSFAPGQTVHIKPNVNVIPRAKGLLFHPDLIRGTSLGHDIKQYNFFAYSSREALHLSEDEKVIFSDCLNKIQAELDRPIDNHSKKLICRNIELLLDYCMRFYERQFITREAVNKDVITKFEELIDKYFESNNAERNGLPSVKYFAEQCFLSPNYFGDLVKKETGRNPQEYIQSKIIELAKDKLLGSEKSVSEISYELGFQYSQHFNRYFKRYVGKTPSEYRTTAV
jgi:AraC-like DNA-binding protein